MMTKERREELAATLGTIKADMRHCQKTASHSSECGMAYYGIQYLASIMKELLEKAVLNKSGGIDAQKCNEAVASCRKTMERPAVAFMRKHRINPRHITHWEIYDGFRDSEISMMVFFGAKAKHPKPRRGQVPDSPEYAVIRCAGDEVTEAVVDAEFGGG